MITKRTGLLARYAALLPVLLLTGCSTAKFSRQFVLFHPAGPLSGADLRFTILDVGVMLGIIIPTAIMTTYFLMRYRKTSTNVVYDPKWSHSNLIELIVWAIPLLTVGLLGYYSYKGTLAVNPYDPRIIKTASAGVGVAHRTLNVDVITTDWQWLFIYPKQHIATANELVIPAGTAVHFRMTSATVVNDFFIPNLAGMIDVMPGMRTKQVLVADKLGQYKGYSANFSGGGFSWMGFKTSVVSENGFRDWVKKVQLSPHRLNYAKFNAFAKPTKNVDGKTDHFSHVSGRLFDRVIQAVMMGKVYTTPLPVAGKA
ncbi:MAG: cytochrome ubiquinol oxidase subunit II [Acidiferrobacter sp.]